MPPSPPGSASRRGTLSKALSGAPSSAQKIYATPNQSDNVHCAKRLVNSDILLRHFPQPIPRVLSKAPVKAILENTVTQDEVSGPSKVEPAQGSAEHTNSKIEPVGSAFQTQILPTDTPERFRVAVEVAVRHLRAGEPVALPTETVYGLAANALDPQAVLKVYQVKGRPRSNPLIVHVASIKMAQAAVKTWPPTAEQLARAFWPGPLTLVLPKSALIPEVVTAGASTVAIRWPAHPVIQAVIRECGFPLAAPSANLANRVSPTEASHVQAQLYGRIPLIVDGGPCAIGIESTVVDLSSLPARILRPGMIHSAALTAVTGQPVIDHQGEFTSAGPRASPGLFPKHYAPNALVYVLQWLDTVDLRRQLVQRSIPTQQTCVLAHERIPDPSCFAQVCVLPHEPAAYARVLYTTWHRCDQLGARFIIMESVPTDPEWAGIADRIRRAQAMETNSAAM